MNKKQIIILVSLVLYTTVGIIAAGLLFFMGSGKKEYSVFSPSSIEAAEKNVIIENPVEEITEDVQLSDSEVPAPLVPVVSAFSVRCVVPELLDVLLVFCVLPKAPWLFRPLPTSTASTMPSSTTTAASAAMMIIILLFTIHSS